MNCCTMPQPRGRHFLQIPGPTNVPERVLRALSAPTIEHRGPACARLTEEGRERVFARQDRHGDLTGRAARAWDLALLCRDPAEYRRALTAVMVPPGHDADMLRGRILDLFNMSFGTGFGRVRKRVFRIGYLGDFNDMSLADTLSGVELGLAFW